MPWRPGQGDLVRVRGGCTRGRVSGTVFARPMSGSDRDEEDGQEDEEAGAGESGRAADKPPRLT